MKDSLTSGLVRWTAVAAVGLGWGTLQPPPAAAQAVLVIDEKPGAGAGIRWTNQPPGLVLETTRSLTPPVSWSPVAQAPVIDGDTRTITAPMTDETRFYRLRLPTVNRLAGVSPKPGETGVAVTRESIVRFTRPLAATASLATADFHAEADGRRLLARVELAADRAAATLFPLEHLPASARIRVRLRGDGLADADGLDLDADGDGAPGGTAVWSYSTAGITPLTGTAVSGHVFASERNPDGSNRPLEGVTITVDGAEETLRTTTDARGFFLLNPCPAGRFFVHVDGRTAVGSAWPGGAYYPFIGKAWEASPGRTNHLAGGTGEIFLPLVPAGALREVSPTVPTPITFNPEVVAANPALAGVQIVVPPNALLADSGVRGGRVGMAPVPPDRLPEPLPPGLDMPLVITIQTDGPQNFAEPVPVRFPNLADPVTGSRLPPGAKSGLWSFNHDTGRWELQGPMTVSADGDFLDSDPGVGVRQPGWHGVNPGSDTDDPAPDPPPDEDDGEEDDPDAPDPWNKCKNEIANTINSALDCAYGAILPDKLVPDPNNKADPCAIGVGLGQFGAVRDCLAEPAGCKATLINNTGGALIGCSDLIGKALGQRLKYIGPVGKVAGFIHGCVLGPGLNFCAMADCLEQSSDDSFCVPDEWEDGMYRWLSDWDFLGNAFHSGPGLAGVSPADAHTLGEAPPEFLAEAMTNPFFTQIRFTLALRQWLTVFYGTDQWFPDYPAEAALGAGFLRRLDLATDANSEGGVAVTASERAELLALPRPAAVTDLDVEAIISRMQRMFDGTLSDEEWNLRALLGSGVKFGEMAAVYEAMGWTDQLEAFKNGLLQISQRFEARCRSAGGISGVANGGDGGGTGGGGGGGSGGALGGGTQTPRSLTYLLLNLDSGFAIRGKTQAGGSLGSLVFAPDTYYALFFVDDLTGTTAVSFFKSAGPGQTTTLPCAMWLNGGLPFPDSDGDGLTDLAERAVGTSPILADSDGDGRSDRVELADDTNPLDGLALPTGLVGAGELAGGAALTVAAEDDRLYVGGTGSMLTVFDLSQPRQPVRLRTLASSGSLFQHALAVRDGRVAVGGPDGLALIDARDPSAPILLATAPLGNVVAVDWLDAEVVALSGAHLHLVNASTGIPRLSLPLPESGNDVQVVGDHVYVLTSVRLIVLRPADFLLTETGRIHVAGGESPLETGRKLFVGGGRAYVGTFTGFSVVEVSNPSSLTLLGTPPSTQAAIHDLAANDAGLLLPVVSFAGTGTLAVGAYDIRDPADVTRFLTSWSTPGDARALTLHRGLAYVADSSRGIQVLNYLPPDTARVAPTATFTANFPLAPARAAFDAPLRVLVEARDDVQVRDVTAFVDDAPAGSDGGFPFQVDFDAPGADSGRTNFTLRLRATDTAGNTRWTDPLVVALAPGVNAPRALSGFPAPAARVDRLGLTNVWVEFDQPLAPDSVDAGALVVTGAGADLLFDTADDVAPEGQVRLVREARFIEWTVAEDFTAGRFRITVAAGLRGTNGVARTEPLSWTFEAVNIRPRLIGSTPAGTTPTPVGGLEDLVVHLDLTPPPQRAAVWGLREAGPDRTRGNADDVSVPLAMATLAPSGRDFRLTPHTPLGAGRYRVTLGGTGFTASQVDFELRPVPNEWVNPAGGLWSTAANWSGGAPLAGDFLRLPRLTPALATTNRNLVVVSRLECAADFVQEPGRLLLSGEGLFDGFSRFLGTGSASIEVDGGGTLVNRGTMAWVGGGPAANRALVLRNITVANRGLLEWQAGQLSLSDPAAQLVNEAAGVFDLGAAATRTLNGISASGRQGRIVNAGLVRKTTGTNIVGLRTVALENSGRVLLAVGGLDLGDVSGPGEIEVQAGSTVAFNGRLTLPPDARITGAGEVFIAGGALDAPQELRHRHEVTGLTAAVSGYTEVRRSLDHPGLQFASRGGWLRFFAPVTADRLWTAKGSLVGLEFHAPAIARVLQLEEGFLGGPAGIDVTESLLWSAGKIEAGNEILVRGGGELRGGGQLSERELRIAPGAVVVALVTNTSAGISPAARGREGRLVNEGMFVKRGPGQLGLRVEFENRGVLRFEEGAVLFERQPSGQGRLLLSGGELHFAGGDLALHLQSINGASLGLVEGVLRGFGRILNVQSSFGNTVRNAASVRLDAPGKALIIENMGYDQTAAGELVVTLGEAGCGQLVGDPAWSLILKGRLRVELEPGFSPALGQSYTVIPRSRSGTFDTVALPDLGGDRKLAVTYPEGQVILTVVPGP